LPSAILATYSGFEAFRRSCPLGAKEIEELNNGTFVPLPADRESFNPFEMKTRIRNLETAGKTPSLEAVLRVVERVSREQLKERKGSKRRRGGKE
jgi:hypothetical protein